MWWVLRGTCMGRMGLSANACTFTSAHGVQLRIRCLTYVEWIAKAIIILSCYLWFQFRQICHYAYHINEDDTNTVPERWTSSTVICADTVAQPIKSNAPEELQPLPAGWENRQTQSRFSVACRLRNLFKFSVVSDNGEEASFYEKKKTNITDGEGKPFPNGWRPKGKKVKVTIRHADGYLRSNEASDPILEWFVRFPDLGWPAIGPVRRSGWWFCHGQRSHIQHGLRAWERFWSQHFTQSEGLGFLRNCHFFYDGLREFSKGFAEGFLVLFF